MPKLDALLFFDYKQIEPRLFAFYLNSIGFPRFAQYIQSGVDPYTAIAIGYFGKEEISDAERQLAKQTLLSLMYGGGAPAIKRYFTHLNWQEANEVRNTFYRQWPEAIALQERIERQIKLRATPTEPGYITTLFGRHLHPDPMLVDDKAPYRKMLNALIQGCAADLMRWALVEVDDYLQDRGLQAHIVSVIHDEIIIDAPSGEIDDIVTAVPWLMAYRPVDEIVPVLADVEWSTTNWAEKAPYERD